MLATATTTRDNRRLGFFMQRFINRESRTNDITESQEARAHASRPPPSIPIQLQINDVLLGRGSIIDSFPGNERFRRIVQSRKDLYNSAPKAEKEKIALDIIEDLSKLNPPGRFLERRNAMYMIVSHKRAIHKTMQALRERWGRSPVSYSKSCDETHNALCNAERVLSSQSKASSSSSGNNDDKASKQQPPPPPPPPPPHHEDFLGRNALVNNHITNDHRLLPLYTETAGFGTLYQYGLAASGMRNHPSLAAPSSSFLSPVAIFNPRTLNRHYPAGYHFDIAFTFAPIYQDEQFCDAYEPYISTSFEIFYYYMIAEYRQKQPQRKTFRLDPWNPRARYN